MRAGIYQFRARRGDRERIGARLVTRDVFTGQRRFVYLADKTITFTIRPDAAAAMVRVWTLASDGGLEVDQATAQVVWPMSDAETTSLAPGTANTVSVRIVDPRGEGGTYLAGTISADG